MASLFGTDGIRTTVGKQPFTFERLPLLGQAIGMWALEKYGAHPKIVLGHDTRLSCSFIKTSLQSGLLLHPVTIYDAQLASTPALCLLTQKKNMFDCGLIISASHNPHQDNGIKIIDARTGKLSSIDEQRITTLFNELINAPIAPTYANFGTTIFWPDAEQAYIDHVLSFFKPDFLAGKKIVLDCANGALSYLAPKLFALLGATIHSLHTTPNGTNINHACGALHPASVQDAVLQYGYDIGFAFDGDGDRIIAINKHGQIKNGDDILALLMQHPLYNASPAIVGTEMTNHGFEHYLTRHNKVLLRTKVGDKYVAQRLEQDKLLLGGEQSGHIILRDYLATGDAVFTALRLLEAIEITQNYAMDTFAHYPQVHINVPIHTKKDLGSQPLATLIEQSNAQLKSGRLVVRYSGTENLLRIMVEDHEIDHAQNIGTQLAHALEKELCFISN